MTEKYELKQVCGEYKFYEKGDSFPLTEKQILTKLNENEYLKHDVSCLHRAMSRDRVKYWKFKDKVFELIDENLLYYSDKYKNYDVTAIEILEYLKKELSKEIII